MTFIIKSLGIRGILESCINALAHTTYVNILTLFLYCFITRTSNFFLQFDRLNFLESITLEISNDHFETSRMEEIHPVNKDTIAFRC